MARLKRNSSALDIARARENAISSIAADLDLGSGLTVPAYSKKISGLDSRIGEYNRKVSDLDALANDIAADERALRDISERMLAAVAVRFGKDSNEYEKAGGVRKSERRRPRRNVATGSAAPVARAA